MLAVALNGLCLQYASVELRSDRQVVLQAIRSNPYAFLGYKSETSGFEYLMVKLHGECCLLCLLVSLLLCLSCFNSFHSSEAFDSPLFFPGKKQQHNWVRLEHADSRLKRDRSLAAL